MYMYSCMCVYIYVCDLDQQILMYIKVVVLELSCSLIETSYVSVLLTILEVHVVAVCPTCSSEHSIIIYIW